MKSYEVGVAINLERNRFHESFIHSLNLLYAKLFIVKDSFAARTLFQKGEVDVLDEIPVQVVESHQKNNTLKTFPFVATYMLGFGFSGGALDLETRKSLSLAVRELEVNQLLITGEKKSLGWVPPSLSVGPIQDKAIKLWNDSETGALPSVTNKKATKKKVSLYFNPSERNTLLAERISRLVYERSNVALRLEPTEWKVLLSTLKSNPPPLYRFAWTAVYPDPLFFLEIFLSDNPNNYGRWKNAEYDRIVKKLLSWPSYERSDDFWELFEKAHRILVVEDPALVPVYSYVKNFLVAPRVLKWNADFRGICDLSVVDIQNK